MANFSSTYPSTRPVFNADFSNAGRLDSRITFSRSDTPPTYAAPSAVHYWSNEKHLSSENLLTYSNPNNAAWNESNGATVTTNAAAAPDGTTTASSIVEDSANSQHRTFISVNASSGETYTLVAYLKANGRTIAQVATSGASAAANVEFDLSGSGTATTRSGSPANSSISQIGSTGWYKCSFQVTAGSTATLYLNVYLCDSANSNSYTGDGSSGVYAYGFNLSTIGQLVHEDTSGQIARQYAPKLKSVSTAGQPRFEYSPTDSASEVMGQSRGLLIEGQVTNVLPFSTNGYNASNAFVWSYDSIVSTENAAVAPSGNLEATLIRENGTTNQHNFYRLITATAAPYTYSIYVKDAGVGHVGFRLLGPASYGLVFNLSDGSTSALYNPVDSYGYEDVGNGWKRIWVTKTLTAAPHNMMIYLMRGNGSVNYAGDNYSGLLWYGAQIEQSSHPSSYIDTGTSGSAATRASDSASMVSSSLFDNGGGTLYAEASQNALDAYNGVFAVSDGTGANTIEILGNSSSFRGQVVNANSTNASFIGGTITVGQFNKHALTFSSSEASYYVNGSEIGTTDSSVVVPTVSEIDIGNVAWSRPLNGHIRKVALYAEPISETAAAALTS